MLLDEDENEFEKSSEKSSHPMANDYELLDEEDPQSSDLKVRKNFVEKLINNNSNTIGNENDS